MSAREWTTVDKSTWASGPWQTEPDKMQWTDKVTRLPCLIVRNSKAGNLCGYVGVSEGHPAFKADYSEVDANVHGGLTYADFCVESDDESRGICHVPDPGTPHRVWWLGFDCAHAWDLSPGCDQTDWCLTDTRYRDVFYVQEQVVALALQLQAIAKGAA